jgi:hypothetical protein
LLVVVVGVLYAPNFQAASFWGVFCVAFWFGVCLVEVVVVQANFDVSCDWLTAGCGW